MEERDLKKLSERITAMEESFKNLERKLQLTFGEIEKKFGEINPEEPPAVEERLREMEDLMLLLQLEQTKIRDRAGDLDISVTPQTPGHTERLENIEKELDSLSERLKPAYGAEVEDVDEEETDKPEEPEEPEEPEPVKTEPKGIMSDIRGILEGS